MGDDFRVIKKKKKEETAEHLRNGEGYEGEDRSSDHQIDGDDDKEYMEESHLQPLTSLIKQKKKKIKKLAESHPCSVCDKIFSTHQALGGQMASHNKSKKIMEEEFTKNEANKVEQSHVEKPMVKTALTGSDSRIRKCKKCGQIFASGQALGGHQRKHNPLPDYSRKESNIAPDHSQKKSNVVFNHYHKECNVALDHGQKKSSSDHS